MRKSKPRVPRAPVPKPLPPALVRPALEGVLDAFQSRPLVGLGDAHGLAQELDFYAALVRHPRFSQEVGNVVVEFGGAAHQSVIDRYVSGEAVPYLELRNVWTDTVGWAPAPSFVGFMNFFAQVRVTNLALPPEQRVRVWLGEPPIDWSKVNSKADLAKFASLRDRHPADVIRREILSRNKKALVIYGGAHFLRGRDSTRRGAATPGTDAAAKLLFTGLGAGAVPYDAMTPALANDVRRTAGSLQATVSEYGCWRSAEFMGVDPAGGDVYELTFEKAVIRISILLDPSGKIEGAGWRRSGSEAIPTLVDEVETDHHDAFFVVAPYTGYPDRSCSARFERAVKGWPIPALASPVRGTTLEAELTAIGSRGAGPSPVADALLFLGPASELAMSPMHPDIYLDEDYRQELGRRFQIMTGQPWSAVPHVQDYLSTPRKFRR